MTTKIKAEGYRINGVFCEQDQPLFCSSVGLQDFENEYHQYLSREREEFPTPSIKEAGSLYLISQEEDEEVEFLDEKSGLIYCFYEEETYGTLMCSVKKKDLKNYFNEMFQFIYYEQNKVPSKRFIENLLKWTNCKDIDDLINKTNAEGVAYRNSLEYSGNPNWDGICLNKQYVARLLKMKDTRTEWIFACNADGGTIPTLIRFVTDKSSDEIQQNYSDNSYDDESGKVAVSLWYCDEYTKEYSNYGHECADCGWASKSAYDLNDSVVKVLNLDAIPVVDLDVELKKPKVNDTGYYDGWVW